MWSRALCGLKLASSSIVHGLLAQGHVAVVCSCAMSMLTGATYPYACFLRVPVVWFAVYMKFKPLPLFIPLMFTPLNVIVNVCLTIVLLTVSAMHNLSSSVDKTEHNEYLVTLYHLKLLMNS